MLMLMILFFKIYVHALTPTCAYLPEVFRKTGVTAEERAGENSAKHSQVTKRFKRDAGRHLADGRGQNSIQFKFICIAPFMIQLLQSSFTGN